MRCRRNATRPMLIALGAFALALSACQGGGAERWELVPANIIINFGRSPASAAPGTESDVAIPAQAIAGQPIEVVILSFGDGCSLQGTTTTELGDHVARIRVFDKQRVSNEEIMCTTELKRFRHRLSLVLPTPGEWRIEVIGVRSGSGPPSVRPAVITRTIVVK